MTPLSASEIRVLTLLKDGASNKLIARDLGLAEATIKAHLKHTFSKIGVTNRTQAAMWAVRHLTCDAPHGQISSDAAILVRSTIASLRAQIDRLELVLLGGAGETSIEDRAA